MNFQQGLARTRTPAFESYWKAATTPKPWAEPISDSYILATLRYATNTSITTIKYQNSDKPFIVPLWKEVPQAVHDFPPLSMPDESADSDEVRRFLYTILTYRRSEIVKGIPLALSHPVAIISAVKRWHHGGHALNIVTGPDWFTDSFLHEPAADVQWTIARILWDSVSRFLMKKVGWMVYPWLRAPKIKLEIHLVRTYSCHQRKQSLSKRNKKCPKEQNRRVYKSEKSKEHELESRQPLKSRKGEIDDSGERKDSMQPSKRLRPAIFSTFTKLTMAEHVVQKESAVQKSLLFPQVGFKDITNIGYPYRFVTNFEEMAYEDVILSPKSDDAAPAKLYLFERVVRHMMNLSPENRRNSRLRDQEQRIDLKNNAVPSIWNNLGDGLEGAKSGFNSRIRELRHRRQQRHHTCNPWTAIHNALHNVGPKKEASGPSNTGLQQVSASLAEPYAIDVRSTESFWSKRRAFGLPNRFKWRV
jgi:hypothetical protein